MPLTMNQFLKECAARRVQNGLEAPPPPARRTRRRKTLARFCEENRDQGEPERLLPPHEIVRSLQLYTAPEFKRQRRVPISVLAHMSNLSRMTIYRIRRGYPLTRRTHTVLTRTISFIEHQQMEWRRLGNEWEAHQKRPNTYNPLPPIPIAPYLETAADRKVFPHRIGGITFNIVHGQ
jgi:hypothetical protein